MQLVRLGALVGIVGYAGACGPKGPPPGFAPDPGLAASIQQIDIVLLEPSVCPGRTVQTSYTATLDDGSVVPFSRRYDEENPPRLHVVMLNRSSANATAKGDGNWSVSSDPMESVMDGFQLDAFLKVRPSLSASVTVAPEYSCLRHEFRFDGRTGPRASSGLNGPDVTVRVGILSSPFHERLIVAGIEVDLAPPFYVLAEAHQVPPADWLRVVTRGGRGGRGQNGTEGAAGTAGKAGCPGTGGGAGGAGGGGGPGGRGGRGGRVIVYAPAEDPFVAGIVDGVSMAGQGGAGGSGGEGGSGGAGGAASPASDRRCEAGDAGAQGPGGTDGPEGAPGPRGLRPETVVVGWEDVFGSRAPMVLHDLIEYTTGRKQR